MNQPQTLSEAAVTQWLAGLRAGDSQAANRLWKTYFERMVVVARRKLAGARRQVRDEEDIALSAFKSFCLGFQGGRFTGEKDGPELWPLLVTLTVNKTIDHLRRENRLKRGGPAKASANNRDGSTAEESLSQLLAPNASPELKAIASESFERLFAALDASGDETLRTIALLRLEDAAPAAIAEQLGCTPRTVQRKIKTIRALWQACDG
jgi:RNA polymerase sigma factor (sigma-70 family)